MQYHGSAHGLRRSMVIYGNQNGPTRLYLTRRIDWCRFHNHTTTPWWPQNGPMGYQILYGYKGWWYNKMVSSTLYMGPSGNILLANTKTFYSECRIHVHFRKCVITLQNFAWLQYSALYSAAHIKREYERGKIRVCVSVLLCTAVTKHTNLNLSFFIFSFDMCSTE